MFKCDECGVKIHYRQRFETEEGKRLCIMCFEERNEK